MQCIVFMIRKYFNEQNNFKYEMLVCQQVIGELFVYELYELFVNEVFLYLYRYYFLCLGFGNFDLRINFDYRIWQFLVLELVLDYI